MRRSLLTIDDTDTNFYVINFIHESLTAIQYHSKELNSLHTLSNNVGNYSIPDASPANSSTGGDGTGVGAVAGVGATLPDFINTTVSSQSRNDIIVYLKINNTASMQLDSVELNQRYKIELNQVHENSNIIKSTAMRLQYRNDPIAFYADYDGTRKLYANPTQIDNITLKSSGNTDGDSKQQIQSVDKYDNDYLFGNFEKIFTPNHNNEAVAGEMGAIVDQICVKGKPVFLLGYGASGSGKTSSLVYFNGGDEGNKTGVIEHLCKKICDTKLSTVNNKGNKPVNKPVNLMYVRVREYYTIYDNDGKSTQKEHQKNYSFDFRRNGSVKSDFNIGHNDNGDDPDVNHAYHVNMNRKPESLENNDDTTPKPKKLVDILQEAVDIDRFVKATPNNPQSSRSHVLIFITFKNGGTLRHLVVGDLAGKENVFQCGDTETIVKFLNSQIVNKKIIDNVYADTDPKPTSPTFYNTQLMEGGGDEAAQYLHDPVNGLADVTDNEEDSITRTILKTPSKLFDFRKPSNSNISKPKVADTYAEKACDYYFPSHHNPRRTSTNTEIYSTLLGNYSPPETNVGIDLITKYSGISQDEYNGIGKDKDSVSGEMNSRNAKKAHFLQSLIYLYLFEFTEPTDKPLIETLDDSNMTGYEYTNSADIKTSGKVAGVSGPYIIDAYIKNHAEIQQLNTERTDNPRMIDFKTYYQEKPYSTVANQNDSIYTHSLNAFNEIIAELKNKKIIDNGIIKKPGYFTIETLMSVVNSLAPNNTTMKWKIVIGKMLPYIDPLDNKPKSIPVVKSFTATTMCNYFMNNQFKSLIPYFNVKYNKSNKKSNIDYFNDILASLVAVRRYAKI
jgi:hypothetical protein